MVVVPGVVADGVVAARLVGAGPGASDLPQWVQWVSALAPVFTLVAALVAASVALLALQQRRVADAKEEWWTRFAWASGLLLDERPDRQEIGVRTLTLLARSDLARAEELEVVDAAWGGLLAAPPRSVPDAPPDAPPEAPTGPPPGARLDAQRLDPDASRVRVLAARGRQEIDARLHRATEPWVEQVAGGTTVARSSQQVN